MLKRLIPVVLILVLAAAAAVYFRPHPKEAAVAVQSEAMKAVPDDAVWIMESHSVPDLIRAMIQSDPLFPSIQKIGGIRQHLQAFREIDSLITRNKRLNDLYGHRPAVISLHQTGKDHYQFLMVLETGGGIGSASLSDLFTGLCGKPGQWSQRTYNGQQINRITFGVDALVQGISVTENGRFLLISPSPILLENSVRQMDLGNGLYNSPSLSRLSHTAGRNALAHVYINLKTFPAWLGSWMNPDLKKKAERFTRYGDWASLDLSVRNDAIWMNGFALGGDTLNSYLNLFKSQVPRKLDAELFLPSNTAAYFTVGIEKPAQYLKNLSDYLGSREYGRKRQRIIDKATGILKENVVKAWTDLGIREVTIGYLCGVADQTIRPIAVVEVKSGKQVFEKLAAWTSPVGFSPSARLNPRIGSSRGDSERDYAVYPMPFEGLPEILGGSFFEAVAGKYFTFIGNAVFLSDDVQTLDDVLHKYALNKTLVNDAVYKSLNGLMWTRSNATFFVIPFKARPLLEEILNSDATATFMANDDFLRKTGAVGLQFNSGSGMSLHNVFASFAEIDYSKPQTIWESRLDAKVFTKPAIVVNHITHDKEILVQDELTNLYLLNSSGRILWKKNIGEKINSEIFQVDVLKNGRLQYLFSTANAIHLIDRNGAWMPKYPVKLKMQATNGMSLIDFDGNRDYRILIACTDNKVYGFDKGGNPLKGWAFGPASGTITTPLQSFKIQNRDYVVFTDPINVYILDRKGAVKVKPGRDFAVSQNNRLKYEDLASGHGSRFLITDTGGTVYSIYLDGTVESKKFGEYSADHYFNAEDVNGDGLNEFIFIDHGRLDIYSQTGDRLNSHKLDSDVTDNPAFFQVGGNKKKIGITLRDRKEIFLFNGDGSVYSGFPLPGQTAFTIGVLDKASALQNLLVGSEEDYLYNYAIK